MGVAAWLSVCLGLPQLAPSSSQLAPSSPSLGLVRPPGASTSSTPTHNFPLLSSRKFTEEEKAPRRRAALRSRIITGQRSRQEGDEVAALLVSSPSLSLSISRV